MVRGGVHVGVLVPTTWCVGRVKQKLGGGGDIVGVVILLGRRFVASPSYLLTLRVETFVCLGLTR